MRFTILLCLCLAACGKGVPVGNGADNGSSPPDILTAAPVPVRVGERGPSLAACNAAGTTRRLESSESLAVRAAPFDNSDQTGAVPAGGRFFVCTSSLDQKWFGIVFSDGFALDDRCGVTDPLPARRSYDGPCKSGWVSSPFVKLIAGNDQAPATNQAVPAEVNQEAARAG
jgi:hypothetical protein